MLLTDPQQVYSIGGEWAAIRPLLDEAPTRELSRRSGVTERMIRYLRRGDRRPSAKTFAAIVSALAGMLE